MKRISLSYLLVILVFLTQELYSQEIDRLEIEVFKKSKIFFYGFDFKNFKLASARKMEEDLHRYMNKWVEYCMEKISPKKLTHYLRKDSIMMKFAFTNSINDNINGKEIAVALKHSIPKNSLQSIINGYEVKDRKGIGLTILMECFEKYTHTTSGYFVFFDLSSKEILMSDHVTVSEIGRYGMTHYWGTGMIHLIKKYVDEFYLPRLKQFKKTERNKK